MITGTNSGIGKEAAKKLAAAGLRVIMVSRNEERGKTAREEVIAATGSGLVDLLIGDMSLMGSVKSLAEQVNQKYDRLDIIIQNAAYFDIAQKKPEFTSEGVESVWATNHLGPVLLTELLLDKIKLAPQGRIITISSKGLLVYPGLKINFHDPEFRKVKYSVQKAYYHTKLAQVMYTFGLGMKLHETRVTANSIRVPSVKVDVSRYPDVSNFMKKIYAMKSKSALEPSRMADTYVYLATSDEVSTTSAGYFDEHNREIKSSKYSYKTDEIRKLMDLTREYLKDYF